MNRINTLFNKPQWLTMRAQAPLNKAIKGKPHCVVLSRECYKEQIRTYKAGLVDLWRLIRNELKVLAPENGRVLWRVVNNTAGVYQVSYAILNGQVLTTLPLGVALVWPETWLLQRILQPGTLYHVSSEQNYWAWLSTEQHLHLAPMQGLMQHKQFFLDAIGVGVETTEQHVDVQQHINRHGIPLSWQDLPGQVLLLGKPSGGIKPNWRYLGLSAGFVMLAYITVSSAWLSWQQHYYQNALIELQAQMATVFEQQQQLEQQAELLAHYQQLLQRFPSSAEVLSALATDLGETARLDNIQSSGRLVQIAGVSPSATQVLASLMASGNWAEVRFERNIQRVREEERFSISMVFQEPAHAVKN